MKIPNMDGDYKTKDGSILVTVTRGSIQIDVVKPKEKQYIIIDEDDRGGGSPRRNIGSSDMRRKLSVIGDGLDGISDALMGRGK